MLLNADRPGNAARRAPPQSSRRSKRRRKRHRADRHHRKIRSQLTRLSSGLRFGATTFTLLILGGFGSENFFAVSAFLAKRRLNQFDRPLHPASDLSRLRFAVTSNAVRFQLGCNSHFLGLKSLDAGTSTSEHDQATLTTCDLETSHCRSIGYGMLALAKTERKSRSLNRASLSQGCDSARVTMLPPFTCGAGFKCPAISRFVA